MKYDEQRLSQIAHGMAEAAKTYPNDVIANEFARVSDKVASLGGLFASKKLDEIDMKVVRFYLTLDK